jgi:hypothetical protein
MTISTVISGRASSTLKLKNDDHRGGLSVESDRFRESLLMGGIATRYDKTVPSF